VPDDAAVIDDLVVADAGRWVEQFPAEDQDVLLGAVRRWVATYHWDHERIEGVLDALLADLRDERVAVAAMQPVGSAQAALDNLFVRRLRAHGVAMPRTLIDADVHVYLDDVLCTGRTLDRHLRRLLPRVRPGASVLVFHLVAHTADVRGRRAALDAYARELGVELRWDHALAVENRPETLGGLEVVAPGPWSRSALDPAWTSRLSAHAFRAPDLFGVGPLYADEDERDVVERALLRAGSRIAARDKRVRPLGAGENGSLGFGALSWTCFGVPATVPPALWWSDDDWFPLVGDRCDDR